MIKNIPKTFIFSVIISTLIVSYSFHIHYRSIAEYEIPHWEKIIAANKYHLWEDQVYLNNCLKYSSGCSFYKEFVNNEQKDLKRNLKHLEKTKKLIPEFLHGYYNVHNKEIKARKFI